MGAELFGVKGPRLHDAGSFDAEVTESAHHFALCHSRGRKQEGTAGGVGLIQDVVAVVEAVELLREREGILGQDGGFGAGDGLLDQRGEARAGEPRLPDAGAFFSPEQRRECVCVWKLPESLRTH